MQEEIRKSGGNEVFFVGTLEEHSRTVNEVRVVCRGNSHSVPAVIDEALFEQVVIHNHPSGNLTPSDQDIEIASVFGNNGVGFYVVNNDISDVYVVVEPPAKKTYEMLDADKLSEIFSPDGPLSQTLGSDFEYRKEQVEAMRNIADSFNSDLISIIEAGTGTGKTLSYLIPAIHWSESNTERVVVSTNTINLQEQLVNKDIPLLIKALNKDISFSLVKGMKNYLCLLRLDTFNEGLFDMTDGNNDSDELGNIISWSKMTSDGSLSDLDFVPSDNVWDRVSAESESCIRAKCPYYSSCFYFKARREMSQARILVTNHHMFFSDLAIKSDSNDSSAGIVPSYRRVVFDEAHNIVDAATSHFSLRVSRSGLIRSLKKLKTTGQKGEPRGLIYHVVSSASRLPDKLRDSVLFESMIRMEEVLSPVITVLEDSINTQFDLLYRYIRSVSDVENHEGYKDINVRITEKVEETGNWKEIKNGFLRINTDLGRLIQEISSFIMITDQFSSSADLSGLQVEFKGLYNRLGYYSEVIERFFNDSQDSNVRWFEGRENNSAVISSIGVSPVDVSGELSEKLYSVCKTVIMTSATLAVRDNFDFQKRQLGLIGNTRLNELVVDSSFDYKKQALLALPDIAGPYSVRYREEMTSFIKEVLMLSGGHALILFTSYSLLDHTYNILKKDLSQSDILLLKQGSLPRSKLLEIFMKDSKSVLLATSSFWEGVDISGDSLRLVFITRLPFRVPTDPVVEARVEYLEKQGLNSFMEYSLPIAVLKLKQGFGRLIRSRNDSGVVIILDSRIYSKSYGRDFLNSLPQCSVAGGDSKKVLKAVAEFLYDRYGQ